MISIRMQPRWRCRRRSRACGCRLMMGTEDVTRETALNAATEFLASVFPKHYARAATGIRVLV